MSTAAANQKKQEQNHEQNRKSSSVVRSLKLDRSASTTRAEAHSPATGNIVYTGLGGNSDESRAAEKGAESRSTVRMSRRKEMEKLIDAGRKNHGSV
jgi:hypothetical protein